MKDSFKLVKYPHNFWQVAELFKNGNKIAVINKFYEVTPDWIYIYGTEGGQGTGFTKGELIQKIDISNAEFIAEFSK